MTLRFYLGFDAYFVFLTHAVFEMSLSFVVPEVFKILNQVQDGVIL